LSIFKRKYYKNFLQVNIKIKQAMQEATTANKAKINLSCSNES